MAGKWEGGAGSCPNGGVWRGRASTGVLLGVRLARNNGDRGQAGPFKPASPCAERPPRGASPAGMQCPASQRGPALAHAKQAIPQPRPRLAKKERGRAPHNTLGGPVGVAAQKCHQRGMRKCACERSGGVQALETECRAQIRGVEERPLRRSVREWDGQIRSHPLLDRQAKTPVHAPSQAGGGAARQKRLARGNNGGMARRKSPKRKQSLLPGFGMGADRLSWRTATGRVARQARERTGVYEHLIPAFRDEVSSQTRSRTKPQPRDSRGCIRTAPRASPVNQLCGTIACRVDLWATPSQPFVAATQRSA